MNIAEYTIELHNAVSVLVGKTLLPDTPFLGGMRFNTLYEMASLVDAARIFHKENAPLEIAAITFVEAEAAIFVQRNKGIRLFKSATTKRMFADHEKMCEAAKRLTFTYRSRQQDIAAQSRPQETKEAPAVEVKPTVPVRKPIIVEKSDRAVHGRTEINLSPIYRQASTPPDAKTVQAMQTELAEVEDEIQQHAPSTRLEFTDAKMSIPGAFARNVCLDFADVALLERGIFECKIDGEMAVDPGEGERLLEIYCYSPSSDLTVIRVCNAGLFHRSSLGWVHHAISIKDYSAWMDRLDFHGGVTHMRCTFPN